MKFVGSETAVNLAADPHRYKPAASAATLTCMAQPASAGFHN
ncbi:MAG: hypothetical protein R3D55_13515 [Chloroflexota bacterium]